MRCHHCQSEMQLTDSVVEGHARQTWYRCPVCDASHTVSQPYEAQLRRVGKAQRCSSERPTRHYRGL